MTFHWPQITIIVLYAMRFGAAVTMHGKPRPLYSMWWATFHTSVLAWLLYEGGFFGAIA